MVNEVNEHDLSTSRTDIYKLVDEDARLVGFIGGDGVIYRARWDSGYPVGRVEEQDNLIRIFRSTRHGEKEVGWVDEFGVIYSHGLFEGGRLGWMDTDDYVVQAGMILGDEEVGRVDGPHRRAAAGALLLIFIPEDAEKSREMQRRE
jgi:hypothetical protein